MQFLEPFFVVGMIRLDLHWEFNVDLHLWLGLGEEVLQQPEPVVGPVGCEPGDGLEGLLGLEDPGENDSELVHVLELIINLIEGM